MKKLLSQIILLIALISFGVPALAEPISAAALFQKADSSRFQLSPQGRYISFVGVETDNPAINIADPLTNKVIYRLQLNEDQSFSKYQWLNDNTLFLRIRTGQDYAKFIITLADGTGRYDRVAIIGSVVARVADNPDYVYFQQPILTGAPYLDLFRVSIEDLKKSDFSRAQRIQHDGENIIDYAYDAKLDRFGGVHFNKLKGSLHFKFMKRGSESWQTFLILNPENEKNGENEADEDSRVVRVPLGFISPTKIGVLTNADTDKIVVRTYDYETKELSDVLYQHPLYDLEDAGFTEDGELDYVAFSQHGLLEYKYFNDSQQHLFEQLKEAFPDRALYTVSQSDDKNFGILRVAGSDEPGRYYWYSAATKEAKLLAYSYHELMNEQFSKSERIRFTSKDGTPLEAFLNLPQSASNSVLIVMPHGGPIGVRETDSFNAEVQYLTSRGFAVLRVNFRGSWGFGKAFMEQGVGQFGKLIEEDISAAVDEVRKLKSFDKLCAMGTSYGGYSSVMLAMKKPELYSCVVAGFGVYDLPLVFNVSNYRSGESREKEWSRVIGENNDALLDVSPVYFADKLEAPILLVAGKQDQVAAFEQTNRFHYVLKQNSHPVESIYYENAGHSHNNWWAARHEAAAKVDFIYRTLGIAYPDPEALTDRQREVFGEDLNLLAEGLRYEDVIQSRSPSAHEYNLLAANYGNGEAAYSVGSDYLLGRGIPKDIALALRYYNLSGEKGYAPAWVQLGRMYLHGEQVKPDWELASSYLERATLVKGESEREARLYQIQFKCLAPEPWRDTEACLTDLEGYFTDERAVELSRKLINRALAVVSTEAELTREQRSRLVNGLHVFYDLNKSVTGLDELQSGAFRASYGKYSLIPGSEQQDAEITTISKAEYVEDDIFGVIFQLNVEGTDRYRDAAVIAVRWTQTDTATQETIYKEHFLTGGHPHLNLRVTRPKLEPGTTWKLELSDLNQKLLYQRDFVITE
ncbi:prolyl oligopeptidase family serine peptidase [Pseudidiomarina sp.]|uniref:prolyl oligopeptidase family serine peptidase n=1 Tax=Pseudidiomarina sp. TaxID=2081707 RepID=UPI00299EE5F9|nr:prolyl oligopeptidase family serine peptidase [Pseudidiomarina sp.]MDX1704847.1 prolyl oligopeptidase family serine peptidase [Pseudidiomarina sp.]